ncbi:general odorant-binding protein 28a-like [Lycorma delicatula]|uniref:general odorant-binding protein 28a-like n=1 Tax=Lycorma delicatula TaxID=130591 RepID=UPI003F51A615
MKCSVALISTLLAMQLQYILANSEKLMEIAEICRQKEGADEGAIEALKERKLLEYPHGKCMAACIFEEMGIIKDNAFNKEGTMSHAEKYFGDQKDKIEKVKEAFNSCETEINGSTGDRCEVANKIIVCSKMNNAPPLLRSQL